MDLSNTKSVKNYVELFKNFKLKVAEAESLGIDQTSSFKSELDGYRAQLIDSYMSDKEGEKAAARAVAGGDIIITITIIPDIIPVAVVIGEAAIGEMHIPIDVLMVRAVLLMPETEYRPLLPAVLLL